MLPIVSIGKDPPSPAAWHPLHLTLTDLPAGGGPGCSGVLSFLQAWTGWAQGAKAWLPGTRPRATTPRLGSRTRNKIKKQNKKFTFVHFTSYFACVFITSIKLFEVLSTNTLDIYSYVIIHATILKQCEKRLPHSNYGYKRVFTWMSKWPLLFDLKRKG